VWYWGHALILAERGYQVIGIDFSKKMLKIGRSKTIGENVPVDFLQGDLRDLSLNKRFDIAMFAVMSYQTTNEDVEDALKTVRRHI
jgi:ubiquinone/menaquinone biosynthesis C-methylase UbiE